MSQPKKYPEEYNAFVVRETPGGFSGKTETLLLEDLPPGEVLIRVHYSSLNYKDALSASGNKGVTSRYPHTPGIDAAGRVAAASDTSFQPGDPVLVTGFDLGMNTPGGFGEYIRVPAGWIVPLPEGLTLQESMIFGTAGFTASCGIHKLLSSGIQPEQGPVAVTGATGGTGSLAVSILSHLGYSVTAITGKKDRHSFLRHLGADEVLDRDSFLGLPDKPLLKGRWVAAIDTVGGEMLDLLLRQVLPEGQVACCGNVRGHTLLTSIFPFILRGITLTGIDSAHQPLPFRKKIWHHLATDWKPKCLPELFREASPPQLDREIATILKGGQTGRVVINMQ